MSKPLVFISHITAEADIAVALKELVETSFLGMIEVFVSSDGRSIELGQKWLDDITAALKTCAVEIIIASPQLITSATANACDFTAHKSRRSLRSRRLMRRHGFLVEKL